MIISHKYKYLFLETPHTASTAISKELCDYYDGQNVLHKHAYYWEFERIAADKEKAYYIFAGVRNPLDEMVSVYVKFMNNHKFNYTDEKKRVKNGGWVTDHHLRKYRFVQDRNNSYSDYLREFYKHAFANYISVNKRHCDYIIKFENLEDDFSQVLKLLNIKQVRSLPYINRTVDKNFYLDYYGDDISGHVLKSFGPFMMEWGYELPEKWSDKSIGYFDKKKYDLRKKSKIYFNIFKSLFKIYTLNNY